MCVLCPRKYETPIRPDWRNPKLLAQFVSLHTGLVYKKNVTGLCQFMQDEVEREVKIAQNIGELGECAMFRGKRKLWFISYFVTLFQDTWRPR
jgi:ribosomal protein S18